MNGQKNLTCPTKKPNINPVMTEMTIQDVYVLDGKEYTYLQAMRILMKGQPNTTDNRKQAHSYLMWRCKK